MFELAEHAASATAATLISNGFLASALLPL